MKRKSLLAAALLGGIAFAASSTVLAIGAVSADLETKEAGGFIGFGLGGVPDYEGSDDYEAVPALFGRYIWESGRYFNLGGTPGSGRAARLDANVIKKEWTDNWEAGPLLQYRFKRGGVDDNKVKKMSNVSGTVEAGAFVRYELDRWSANLSFAGDVGGVYKGWQGYLTGGYHLPINDRLKFKFGAHLTYADTNYMKKYFGVDSADARRSGLQRYKPSGGLKDWGLSVTGNYQFNKTWGLMANLGYTRMINDAEDSPLVNDRGDDNQYTGVLAVTYAF